MKIKIKLELSRDIVDTKRNHVISLDQSDQAVD